MMIMIGFLFCETYKGFFCFVLKDKLVPHFGKTEQVGFEFFMYHLSLGVFGIVDATQQLKYGYITDKLQAGAKDGNHTINYITQ